MWVSTLPWNAIGQSALSETIGSLIATGLVAGGSWLLRSVRRRRRSKTAAHTDEPLSRPAEHHSQIDV
ncbi:hypothetical protein SAMN02787118_11837 [Streptomyces mirabilis]|uniref:Uncharacterized protein n=1 Tax=Streptomyces mirabilis TaxID=68239 RepID=A0A1I2QMU2_9ACTN|nr:hypothetical protein SAMN02787118_11837 [Streptomyces mirabilis]